MKFAQLRQLVSTAWLLICILNATSVVGTAQEFGTHQLDFPAAGLTSLPESHACWLWGGHSLAYLDGENQTEHHRIELADSLITAVVPIDQRLILVAGSHRLEQGMVGLYDLQQQSFSWLTNQLNRPVTAMIRAGDLAIIGNDLGEVAAYDRRSGDVRWQQTLHSKMVTTMINLSGSIAASGDWVGKIVLFDVTTGQGLADFQQHRARISDLAILEKAESPLEIQPVERPSPFVSASQDGTVRLWYPTQRRLVRFVQLDLPATAAAYISATQVVAATSDSTLHLIDLEQAQVIASLKCPADYVTAIERIDSTSILAVDGKGLVVKCELSQFERQLADDF